MAEETRRRGAALEEAILDAGWDLLMEAGYAGFTVEAVAERAKTGKAAIYRRWPDRVSLLMAAIAHRHHGDAPPPECTPDTGSLRGDMLELVRGLNERAGRIAALFSTVLGGYFAEEKATPAELRVRVIEGRDEATDIVVQRAIARGEIEGPVHPRVVQVAIDLVRHDVLMNVEPLPDEALVEIVDEVFMPLVGSGTISGRSRRRIDSSRGESDRE